MSPTESLDLMVLKSPEIQGVEKGQFHGAGPAGSLYALWLLRRWVFLEQAQILHVSFHLAA